MLSFDVRVTEDLDALLLRCRDGADEVDALRALRRSLPDGADVRRSVTGIRVGAQYAPSLLSPGAGVDVRWTESVYRYATNRRVARAVYPGLRESLRALREGGAEAARRTVADSPGLDVLDAHQLVNVAAMTLPDGFGVCLFDEQGAGKTVSLIFAYDLLAARGEADQVLVVAPKSMVPEWPKDFARFRPGLYRVTVVAGTSREKRAALRTASDVYVTNFETVVSLEAHFEALLRPRADRSVLVVDESFFVKSPDAKRTRALRRLREWCGRPELRVQPCRDPEHVPRLLPPETRLTDHFRHPCGLPPEQRVPVRRPLLEPCEHPFVARPRGPLRQQDEEEFVDRPSVVPEVWCPIPLLQLPNDPLRDLGLVHGAHQVGGHTRFRHPSAPVCRRPTRPYLAVVPESLQSRGDLLERRP